MDDDDDNERGPSRHQLSFSLEKNPISVAKEQQPSNNQRYMTSEDIKKMDEIAQNLSKHGCSFLESTVCGSNGCPKDMDKQIFEATLKNDAKFLHDRLNSALGYLEVTTCDCRQPGLPNIIGLNDLSKGYLKLILAGNSRFEDFISKLKKYHSALRCNVVWRQNTVAYRCHTCGLNSCMSLCAQCFEEADHEGHDYSRFFSTVGGCCDCGNPDVMSSAGFCPRHCEGAPKSSDIIPPHSLALLKTVLAKLLSRSLVCLRRWCTFRGNIAEYLKKSREPTSVGLSSATNDIMNRGILPIINFITELCDAGSAVSDILIEFMLDKNFYLELCRRDITSGINDQEDVEAPDWRLLPELKADMDSLSDLRLIRSLPDVSSLHPLAIDTLLDELILYLIRIAFPQEMIDMLLNLLYDTKYKEIFAKKFFSYYPYITAMVGHLLSEPPLSSREGGKIAERIVHISVQICSGSNICSLLQKEINIILCVVKSAVMMSVYKSRPNQLDHSELRFYATNPAPVSERLDNEWLVVSTDDNPFYEKNADLFVLTDTQNLLVHQPIAKELFHSEDLVELYIRHIELFQGFTVEWRISSGDHRQHDWVVAAQRSYNVEFEACSLPMHNLLQHATTLQDCHLMYFTLIDSLNRWFKAVNLERAPNAIETPPFAITFHLPLHRHLATLIFQMQTNQCNELLENLSKNKAFLQKLILHPLRIHIARSQYYAGMWLRNGQGMRIAVSHYCKPTITFSFQSADLIILRFAASFINQEFFLTCLLRGFSIPDCFAYESELDEIEVSEDSRNLVTRKGWVPHLLDGALRLLLDLVIGRRDTEPDSNELVKEEMITLLARQDLPYSHVKAVIPSRGNICFDKQMEVFDEILNEVTNFVEPDQDNSLQHGRYELKDEYFDSTVCPVFCRLRSFGSLDYSEFVTKIDGHERPKSKNLPASISPWLGYRMYNFDKLYSYRFESVKPAAALLTQPSFFIMMSNIIDKVLSTDYYYSLVLQQTIYLLTLSVQFVKSDLFEKCRSQLYHPNEFMEPAFTAASFPSSIREAQNPRQMVIKLFIKSWIPEKTLLSSLVELFIKSAKAQCPTASDRQLFALLKEHIEPVEDEKLERIHGAGMEYIGRLLSIILKEDEDYRKEVTTFVEDQIIVPTDFEEMNVDSSPSSSQASSSEQSSAERKAQLKAKKEAYLKKLQTKNAKMMKLHMDSEGISQAEMDRFDTKTVKESTYLCPICSETTNHSLANPIGLFVHTRPNAVVPNSVSADEKITDVMQLVPTTSSSHQPSIQSKRKFFDQRDQLCLDVFSKAGPSSVKSLRFRTGIEVKTCFHFAHLSCFKSYVDSIKNNPTHNPSRMDFHVMCPMCRTPVNTILPLKMEYGREKIASNFDINDLNNLYYIKDFYINRLRDPRPIFNKSQDAILHQQSTEYRQVYEEFEEIAYRQLVNCYETPETFALAEKRFKGYSARLGYVQSNIDKLIMFTSLDLPLPSFTKGSVVEHILSGAITLSLFQDQEQILTHFNWLTDSISKANYDGDSEMPPLLICDYQSMYLRCVALPMIDERFVDSDRNAYCSLLYRIMTTLCLTRAIQNTISKSSLTSAVNEFIEKANFGNDTLISQSLQKVFEILRPLLHDVKTRLLLPAGTTNDQRITFNSLEEMIEYTKEQATHILSYFLKFVVILSKEISKEDLTVEEKFKFQANDVEGLHAIILGQDAGDFATMASSSRYFLEQLIFSLINGEKVSQILVSENFSWKYRQLLNLPREYDKLFSAFFGKKCENCHRQPKHQMLCLLCGQIMCLNKCNQTDERTTETETYIEKHTISCGAGCSCYLSLNSTMIVINYYRLAVLWGTVYLDSHGEEDRNLIRGKPLFLSDNRIKQLQRSWLTQDLENRPNLRWFTLDQLSMALRQSHHNL